MGRHDDRQQQRFQSDCRVAHLFGGYPNARTHEWPDCLEWPDQILAVPSVELTQLNFEIDWIRLVNLDSSLCRQVTWSGFTGAVDLYLDADGTTNGNETLLAPAATNNTASLRMRSDGLGAQLLRRRARARNLRGARANSGVFTGRSPGRRAPTWSMRRRL